MPNVAEVIRDHVTLTVSSRPTRSAKVHPPKIAQIICQPFTQAEITALWAVSRQTHQQLREEVLVLLAAGRRYCGSARPVR